MLSKSRQHMMKLTSRCSKSSTLLASLSVVVGHSTLFAHSFVPAAGHLALSASSRSFTTSPAVFQSAKESPVATWSFDEACTEMPWNEMHAATMSLVDSPSDAQPDLVVLGVFAPPKDESSDEEESESTEVTLSGAIKAMDEELGGAIASSMVENAKAFRHGADAGSTTPPLRVVQNGQTKRVVVIGMGTPPTPEQLQDPAHIAGIGFKVGKALASLCDSEKKVETARVFLPGSFGADASLLQALSTSFYSKMYSDNRFRTAKKIQYAASDLKSVELVSEEAEISSVGAESLEAGKKMATGIAMTKDIVNSPHNVLNSLSLATTAQRIAAESGGTIKCTILGKKECEERGMGAYLGVARASETEPQFIHLTYSPPDGQVNKRVGIVGKGLLFDTGGYNIKTAMMEQMKFDCGGAAAVLGAARAVGALQPPGVEAHFVVAACENMINERGVVPSDILVASNGKTIEVLNTDAEGRLTLADALVYCDKELDCESIIELSTLTGACMVALGKSVSGMWTDNEALAAELADIAKVTDEKTWRMPMEKSYNKDLESKIADIKNIGGRWGGSITAALFLQNFVDTKKPFSHIDIAGPVWDEGEGSATGYGAKLVTEWVRRNGVKEE